MRTGGRDTRNVFLITGIVMLACETAKQLILTLYGDGYQFWYLPFQLCSIPMYAAVLAGAVKKGNFTDACESFIGTFGLLAGIMAFFDTSGFHYDIPILTVYSYVWHILLIMLGIYANVVRRSFRFIPPMLIFLVSAGIAELINYICRNELINMFYINPKYMMAQIGFRMLVEPLGNTAAILIYIAGIAVGAGIINAAAWLIRRRIDKN